MKKMTVSVIRMRSICLALSILALSAGVSAVAQVQDIYRINDGKLAAHVDYRQVGTSTPLVKASPP